MLYPLEVEDNETIQQPTPETLIQNSEPEKLIATRTRVATRIRNETRPISKSIMNCLYLMSLILITAVKTNTKQDCKWISDTPFNMPQKWNYNEITHQNVTWTQATVYTRTHIRIPEIKCKLSNPHLMNGDIIIDEGVDQWQSKNAMNLDSKDQLIMKELNDDEENKSSKFEPANIKFQFIFDVVNLQFKQQLVETQRRSCESRNNLLLLIEWLSTSNPTLAAKLLLQRSDIIANRVDNKLYIAPCNVNKSEWKRVEFKAGIVSKFKIERINAELEILAQRHEIINLKTNLLKLESLWTEVEQQGEELIEQLTVQFEKITETIEEELAHVIAHWKIITIGVFSSVILILIIVVELKFKLISFIFHFLCNKNPNHMEFIPMRIVQVPLNGHNDQNLCDSHNSLSYNPIIHSSTSSSPLLSGMSRKSRKLK